MSKETTEQTIAPKAISKEVLGEKETEKESQLLIFLYPDAEGIENDDVLTLIEQLDKINGIEKPNIDLLLNSNGGLAYVAYKMVNLIRSKCNKLRVIIPNYAKSAATLMALGADEIVMGVQSELGPLDKPMEHPITENINLSALDGVRSLEFLADFCSTKAIDEIGMHIRNFVRLGRKESIEIALKFMSDFIQPIASKLDPWLINMCYRHLLIAQNLGKNLLMRYMFKGAINSEQTADIVITELVWGYPEHGFIIDADEARRIGLKITNSENFLQWGISWEIYKKFINSGNKIIRLSTYAEIESILKPESINK